MAALSKHTAKSGPGRRHVEGTYRGSKRNKGWLPNGFPGAKLARKAITKTIGLR